MKPSSTCRRRCRPGCGSSTQAARTRPTRTTLVPRRSSRCAMADFSPSHRSITRRCCGCWRTVTTTSSPCGPRPCVGCTLCCVCSLRVACPASSPPIGPRGRCVAFDHSSSSTSSASAWPPTWPVTCAASITSSSPSSSGSARGHRVGDHGHRHPWGRPDRCGADRWPHRRRAPLRDRRAFRPLQRHCTHRSVEWPESAASPQPSREPPAQPRPPHGGSHASRARHARPRLLPTQARRGQEPPRSATSPKASHQRRRPPPAPRRYPPPLKQRAREDRRDDSNPA